VELSLGVNESSIHALLPALATFSRSASGRAGFACTACFSRDIPHEVVNYRLDLGAVSFVPRATRNCRPRKSSRTNSRWWCRQSIPWQSARKWTWRNWGKEPFIAHIVESPFRRKVIELFARKPHGAGYVHGNAPRSKASNDLCRWEWAWRLCRACA